MSAPSFTPAKLTSPAERRTGTVLDTIEVTPKIAESWDLPPFQRELRVNPRVQEIAEQIKTDGGVLPGVLTLGILNKKTYLLDGQHRRKAFLLSGCSTGYVDVRVGYYETMAEMGEEFVRLNSQIVRLRPDDILRGLEQTSEGLRLLRKECPFIGYDNVRRNQNAGPILSMSLTLRSWRGSAAESPVAGSSGVTAAMLAKTLDADEARQLSAFLQLAYAGWGRDESYKGLWNTLNLTLCMWLYRRVVLALPTSGKVPRLAPEVFRKCLMALSASSEYLDWLGGRRLTERDRSPCYMRIRALFAARIAEETGKKPNMPAPVWYASR